MHLFLIIVCCFSVINSLRYLYEFHLSFPKDKYFGARDDVYREIGIWIKGNTNQNSTIASPEVGTIGYYGERKMIDLFAIVTPQMLPHRYDWGWAIKNLKPDYFIYRKENWNVSPDFLYSNPFYSLLKKFNNNEFEEVLIFKRKI